MVNWEMFYLQVIRKQKKGISPCFLRFLFSLMSIPYRAVIGLKNIGYDRGWFSRYSPPVPLVISVGNIVAGGAGKTPVALMIIEQFYNQFPLAVLSRGYRSQAEKLSHPVVVSKGHGPTHPASYSGDEAFLAAKNFPKAIVVVGKDRRKSALAASRLGAKMIVLDDALQHRRIARDKEVIVMDMNDPYGLGHFLPRGLLREGISALSRADLIILNHTQDHLAFEKFKIELSHHTSAPVVGTKVEVTGAYTVNSGESVSLDGKKAAVFCGIAHPDYFVKTVEGMGAKVVCEHFMPDHDPFSLDRLIDFSREATKLGAEFLVCTEKDQVKMGSVPEGILPVVWIKMRLTVTEGKKAWTDFIEQGKELLRSQI